jgi:hypothetical protein
MRLISIKIILEYNEEISYKMSGCPSGFKIRFSKRIKKLSNEIDLRFIVHARASSNLAPDIASFFLMKH